jgi:uridine kinase
MNPFVIGIAGGSGAGKTTIAQRIIAEIGAEYVASISYDAYYNDLSNLSLAERQACNFDHPDAFDTALCITQLDQFCAGQAIHVPSYDFALYTRVGAGQRIESRPILLIDGILILVDPALRQRMHLRVFIDTADDLRIVRRILRDTRERGRSVESVCQQYIDTVRPMHHAFVEPSRAHADMIIPGANDATPALEVICNHIRHMLHKRRPPTS